MAWPPSIPPNNRSDSTDMLSNHASDHNLLADAVTELVDQFRSSGTFVQTLTPTSALTGNATLRYMNGWCSLIANVTRTSGSTDPGTMYTVPVGYRPPSIIYFPGVNRYNAATYPVALSLDSDGTVDVRYSLAPAAEWGEVAFYVTWPVAGGVGS